MVSSWGLGRAAVCDCGTPWTFLLPFFFILRGDLFYVLPCAILYLSVLLALRLPRLGKRERVNLSTFVLFAFVWFCLFPLPLGVWERLRFVFVALPGLFSYRFFY